MGSKTKKSVVDDISVQTKGYLPHSVPDVNLLPFAFTNYSGSAKISQFFLIESIPEQDHVPGYLRSFFRGKEVRGTKINIPKNYTGLIIREKQSKDEDDQLGMEEEEEEQENKSKNKSKNWTIVNAQEDDDDDEDLLKGNRVFQEFHYWNREVTPSKNDRIHKWFKWMELSENIHAAISKDDLEKHSLPSIPHSKETSMQSNKKETEDPELQDTKEEDGTLEKESLPPKRRISSEKQEQTSKKKKT